MTDWVDLLESTAVLDEPAVVALNKPAGISVTGERHGTDVVRLAAEAGQDLYPVHRIDKATSGLVLFARELSAHGDLTRQFQRRTVDKTYLMLTRTRGLPDSGLIDLPLSQGRKNRVRVAAPREAIKRDDDTWTVPSESIRDGRTYPSQTRFRKLWQNRRFTLLAVTPVSGRRHQIRVHLAWVGHPVHGDPLFDKDPQGRMGLHAWRLGLDATWRAGERVGLEAPPGDDFWEPVSGIDVATVLDRARMLAHRGDLVALPSGELGVHDGSVAGDDRPCHPGDQCIDDQWPIIQVGPVGVGRCALLDQVSGQKNVTDGDHQVACGMGHARMPQVGYESAQVQVDRDVDGAVRHQDLDVTHLLGDVGRQLQTDLVGTRAHFRRSTGQFVDHG